MSGVKPYSKYEDCGQEWLGDLPVHWDVIRTRMLFNLVCEPAPVGNSEELLSVYTALGVKPRKDLEARGNKASSTDNYWRVEQGDIIVNKLLAWMGAIGISEYKGVTSPAYDILRHKENVNPYFYNYLFRNPIASREFKRHSRGIMDMRLRLYFTRFGDIKLPYPPIDEQNKIVEYLQFKLKKINRFIQKKKQLIKLLNEQKAAIINQAVTKGIDPNAKMKDSGIEWLGDIPEHWGITRLKTITKEHKQGYYDPSGYFDEGVKLVRITDIQDDGSLDYSQMPKVQRSNDCNAFLIKKNDFLFARTGGAGRMALVEKEEEAVFASYLIRFRFDDQIEHTFLKYYFFSNLFLGGIKLSVHGGVNQNVHAQNIKAQIVAFPKDRGEQSQIVKFLNEELSIINQTISTIKKEITLTQEYKTALIAEAVTGKIDVRDFEIPEVTEEESYQDLEEELSLAAEDEAAYQTEN
ncbi:restriction endonuclease subunit S [Algoriphagus marincola]|uniref:restriction endonuclease subunit S n=1 Tax=Algoriphagus marincola TaxID=264027 RepID=UPI000419A708|nr:restriction endonuclease subunit S [Algoriphagus marincola]